MFSAHRYYFCSTCRAGKCGALTRFQNSVSRHFVYKLNICNTIQNLGFLTAVLLFKYAWHDDKNTSLLSFETSLTTCQSRRRNGTDGQIVRLQYKLFYSLTVYVLSKDLITCGKIIIKCVCKLLFCTGVNLGRSH